jgi:glycosyltransferase involved in cell wall biosynthesis
MACGLPIIATNYPLIRNNFSKESGFLVKNGDYKDLARKIFFLTKNQDLRNEMSRFNLKEAKKYTWHEVAKEVNAAIKSVMD